MILIRRKFISVILVIFFFLIGFLSAHYLRRPRIRLGEHLIYINYRAKINPKKNYQLKLWDYKWPGPEGDNWYQPFIHNVVADFEREYPNIKVEINLLDFQSGSEEFIKALALGEAPDVYCSAYDIPKFNYRRQIPVGIFLKPEELNVFYPGLKKLVTFNNYQLTLPRWSSPGIWIGNRKLMEKVGLSVDKIQKQGWRWQDLTALNEKTAPVCAANYGANGLLSQLLATTSDNRSLSDIGRVLDIISFINGPLPQKSDYEANMLQLFLSGKTLFLGGIRPIIFDFIKQKVIERGIPWEPVLLPVPTEKAGRFIQPVESSVIGIYRHKMTKGDDQIAAAARLAYFISIYRQTTPWERLKVIPAVPTIAERCVTKLGKEYYGYLTYWLNWGDIVKIETGQRYYEEVYPGLKDYLNGKINRQEIEGIIKEYF
jgi:hypothetical protein